MFCVVSCMVSFVVKLADTEHKSSEAYLVKFKENLSVVLQLGAYFSRSRFLKNVYILNTFSSIKK